MSLAQGNNTPTRPRIEPGSPDPESDALTTRPVRPPPPPVTVSVISWRKPSDCSQKSLSCKADVFIGKDCEKSLKY